MSKIYLNLEVRDRYGSILNVFTKEIESEQTPHKDMVFSGNDYTLEAKNVYFNLDDGTILVGFIENTRQEEINVWDFLETRGWKKLLN